jgi:hypothetical protein
MGNISGKFVEKGKAYILFSVAFFPEKVPFVRKWKNILESDRPQAQEHCILDI